MNKYQIHFYNIPEKQLGFLEKHFDDYSWDGAFSVEQSETLKTSDSIIFTFTSPKIFIAVEEGELIPDNLMNSLIGKEQFFSNVFYQFMDDGLKVDDVEVFFISDEQRYGVELSKYSGMTW